MTTGWPESHLVAVYSQCAVFGLLTLCLNFLYGSSPDAWRFANARLHIHLLGIVSLVSINQRSFALILKEKVHWCCTILTPQLGRIGKRCVLSRAKVSIWFRIIEVLEKKIPIFFDSHVASRKTSGLFFVPSRVSSISSLVFGKRFALLLARSLHSVFSHAHVRLNGHAPTHHALSEFAILAFTLHLHT